MSNLLEKPKVTHYTVDPYSARVLILQLEQQYDITIRIYEGNSHITMCIDKEERKEDEQL